MFARRGHASLRREDSLTKVVAGRSLSLERRGWRVRGSAVANLVPPPFISSQGLNAQPDESDQLMKIRGNVTARQATVGGKGNSKSWWVT